MTVKKIPMRSCTGCKEKKPKKELVRIIKTAEGEILFDATGKKSGRGAYICKKIECLEKAKKSKALSRSLECEIPLDIYDKLKEEISQNE